MLFLMPEVPRCKGLQKQHFQTVLYGGSLLFAFLHEEGLVRVVDEIVEQGVAVHSLVGKFGTFVCMWIHSYRGTVYDYVVLLDNLWCYFVILYGSRALESAHVDGLESKRFQSIVDGFGCAAST